MTAKQEIIRERKEAVQVRNQKLLTLRKKLKDIEAQKEKIALLQTYLKCTIEEYMN